MAGREPPPLALTMGEPAGIGGELTLAAWEASRRTGPAFVVLDDPARLERLAGTLGRRVPIQRVAAPGEAAGIFPSALPVLPLANPISAEPARPRTENGAAVVESIERAVALTRAGLASGVVTNPINKAVLAASGFAYPGHTEFLGALAGVKPVMMLASEELRVVPVTVHVALSRAIKALDRDLIVDTATITAQALREMFGIARPRLAISGLNPHAGEDGTMGREDIEIIAPAIDDLRRQGIEVSGPRPADALFTEAARKTYDAALCMYHDQALIPIKTLAMDRAVNVTLGLPFIRTSPDHGTAFDIAGKGVASASSLLAAIELAAELATHRMPQTSPP